MRDNNVAHSIFCPDVLSFELTIHLHSLFPPLHTEDIITVILPSIYSPATAYSLPGSLHYSEKSIDGNTIKVQVLTDNQFDIQLAILSILQPHPVFIPHCLFFIYIPIDIYIYIYIGDNLRLRRNQHKPIYP